MRGLETNEIPLLDLRRDCRIAETLWLRGEYVFDPGCLTEWRGPVSRWRVALDGRGDCPGRAV